MQKYTLQPFFLYIHTVNIIKAAQKRRKRKLLLEGAVTLRVPPHTTGLGQGTGALRKAQGCQCDFRVCSDCWRCQSATGSLHMHMLWWVVLFGRNIWTLHIHWATAEEWAVSREMYPRDYTTATKLRMMIELKWTFADKPIPWPLTPYR